MKRRLIFCMALLATAFMASTAICDEKLAREEKLQRVYGMYQEGVNKFPDVKEITAGEAMKGFKKGEILFVDDRKPKEMEVSMLPGAVPTAFFLQSPHKWKDKTVVVYCTIGYRSGLTALSMGKEGISMKNLKGGLLAWLLSGGKVYDKNGETRRAHVYGKKWNYLPEGYKAVMFGFFGKYM